MASTGDKLSPIFKSLHPDESHRESAAAVVVQEAEQRWPLFRAIAPIRPTTTPELTDDERLHWLNPANSSPPPQHKLALSVPGLNEQLAQGLGKLVDSKSSNRRASSRAKPQSAEVQSLPVAKSSRSEGKKLTQELPKTFKAVPDKVEEAIAPTPAPTATPAPARVAAPARKSSISTESPAGSMVVEPKAPVKTTTPAQKTATPEVPSTPKSTKKSADNTSESLKSLFGRLEAPEKPAPKVTIKKSNFLGRLGKR